MMENDRVRLGRIAPGDGYRSEHHRAVAVEQGGEPGLQSRCALGHSRSPQRGAYGPRRTLSKQKRASKLLGTG